MKHFLLLLYLFLYVHVTNAQNCFHVTDAAYTSGQPVIISKITFVFNKPEPDSSSFDCLDELVDFLKTHDSINIQVRVHSDSRSAEAMQKYGWKVTEARARAVADYLVNKGINANRVSHTGMGDSEPIIPSSIIQNLITLEEIERAHATNRRCDFKITQPSGK